MDRLHLERPGARYLGDGTTMFEVWAPAWDECAVEVRGRGRRPMARSERGYWTLRCPARPGERYAFVDGQGRALPDPASLAQPEGVHGWSEVVDTAFDWTDADWPGLERDAHVFYELHVGAFTSEGTFDAVAAHLGDLSDLGISAIELMPIAQFPGTRNWGYDGTYPYAAQHSYGGIRGLQRLADACHARGMAIILDVVYNHLGPEGNYAPAYGPYFTDVYRTPWGAALNFDGADSDEVRRFFLASALFWVRDCHIDGFRLDAIHSITDARVALPFVEELSLAVHEEAERLGRRVHLFGETSRNDPRYVEPPARGGMGLDGQWNEDFHHALHALLTGERQGYYIDYESAAALARGYSEGYTLQGEWSEFYRRRHGRPSVHLEPSQFVVFSQNHDQVGNRARADRLAALVSPARLRLAAAAVALSPSLPLFFMGEEYGERAPFWYFVDHGDPGLLQAVREGRAREFGAFGFGADMPDPAAEDTFEQSKLQRPPPGDRGPAHLLRYYRELLRLRRETPALREPARTNVQVEQVEDDVIVVYRRNGNDGAALVLNFGGKVSFALRGTPAGSDWRVLLDSNDPGWGGSGDNARIETDGSTTVVHAPPDSALLLGCRVSV